MAIQLNLLCEYSVSKNSKGWNMMSNVPLMLFASAGYICCVVRYNDKFVSISVLVVPKRHVGVENNHYSAIKHCLLWHSWEKI